MASGFTPYRFSNTTTLTMPRRWIPGFDLEQNALAVDL